MGKSNFTWKTDTLSGNVRTLPSKVQRAVVGATEYGSTKATTYGKRNAKWVDRTGNARQSFRAYAVHERGRSTIIVAHGQSYGIWLEVRFSGRYAIIGPTLAYTGPLVMRLLGNLFSGDIKGTS
jgi:hypothetical protein